VTEGSGLRTPGAAADAFNMKPRGFLKIAIALVVVVAVPEV